MILYLHNTGPLVSYDARSRVFHVQDLNPSFATHWLMSRFEMLRLGWRCILAASTPCYR